jgi:ribulose 1,5-bisphosphate synthetase/thiazole synthase
MSMNNTENTSSAQISRQSQVEQFDLLILGGGTGSTVAAWTLAGEEMRVAAIDRKYIGGSVSKYRVSTQQKHRPQRQRIADNHGR